MQTKFLWIFRAGAEYIFRMLGISNLYRSSPNETRWVFSNISSFLQTQGQKWAFLYQWSWVWYGNIVILLFVHHVNNIDQGNFQLFLPVRIFKNNNYARKIYLDTLFTACGKQCAYHGKAWCNGLNFLVLSSDINSRSL